MAIIIKKIGKDIEGSVVKALEELKWKPQKEQIFIKPNIVGLFKPNSPFITNPRVVGGIIDYLKKIGINDIIVGEGPVGKNVKEIFEVSGYTKLCRNKKVQLVDLENIERIKKKFRSYDLSLPKIVFEREYINVSKLKTHIQTKVSLGIKNQKGLLRLSDKRLFHKNLHYNIAYLATVVQPSLSIIDAINGVEGNGPSGMGREVRGINIIILGTNFLATDVAGTKLMGIDPEEVRHLMIAKDLGVGTFTDKMEGLNLEDVKINFLLPSSHHRIFNLYYWWTDETCSGCSDLMSEVKREIFKRPWYLVKLLFNGFLRRLDIITGCWRIPPSQYGKVICVGDCSRELAEKYKFPIAQGCPPKPEAILKEI